MRKGRAAVSILKPRAIWFLLLTLLIFPEGLPGQAIREFPVPAPGVGPHSITAGPDGALWFACYSDTIGRITTAGAITEFVVGTGTGSFSNTGPLSIVSGPDGALWFGEAPSNINRITTAGVLTGFTLPHPYSFPTGIVVGSDGALWFAEGDLSHRIGRITTSGTITEFPLPPADLLPGGITAGPDGAIWLTAFVKIGRITTTGVFTEFPVSQNAGAWGITVGPDRALWFAEESGNKIGRMLTNGVITNEFPIPTAGSYPKHIVAGSDGALWFTEFIGNKIGRITTAGAISEFAIPTASSQPYGIASGPDGAIWFAETVGNKIGQITLSQVPAVRLVVTNDFCLVGICPTLSPPAPTTIARGEPFTIYVTGFDASNSRVGSLTNAVHFSTTDPSATLPSDFVFHPEDHAVRTFTNGAVFRTPGVQTITVSDPSNALATGSLTLTVTDAVAIPMISGPRAAVLALGLALTGLCLARLRR